MTRPLNDDGTVPKRRYLRLSMQVMDGNDVVLEVGRELRPKWTEDVEDHWTEDSMSTPPMTPEQHVEPVARGLAHGSEVTVLEMARELLLQAVMGKKAQ